MGEETKKILEKLRQNCLEEQEKSEQEVFHGLNSTDTVLNLVREGLALLSDISTRQDGLCMAVEAVMGEESVPTEDAGGIAMQEIAGYLNEISNDILNVASIFQAVMDEAEHTNQVLHQLEESLVEYATANDKIYQKIS